MRFESRHWKLVSGENCVFKSPGTLEMDLNLKSSNSQPRRNTPTKLNGCD